MSHEHRSKEAQQIEAALDFLKENFPELSQKFNSRMHHVKAKYAGVIAGAVAACEILGVVIGI